MHIPRWIILSGIFCTLSWGAGPKSVTLERLDPTPLFPRTAPGEALKQRADLHLDNPGAAVEASVTVRVGAKRPYTEDLGSLPTGKSVKPVSILDISSPAKVMLSVREKRSGRILASLSVPWQPQKKWNIYSMSFSHQDFGYGNYPHRTRTEARHTNIEYALKFCTATDAWDEDSKFRFVMETGEPITSFLGSHSEADARELARRVREGRIQVGALHSTVNTEQLSHELLARLLYLSGRHQRDLLGTPALETAMNDDVIGLTWPLTTVLKEAGIKYLFHGRNPCCKSLQPAQSDPVFYWQAPGEDAQNRVLVRSTPYSGPGSALLGAGDEARIQEAIREVGDKWPFDSLLLENGDDLSLISMNEADKIHTWNQKYLYPRVIYATLDMFFEHLAAQLKSVDVKSFAKDGNNQWADEDATDAWLLGLARTVGESVPTAEKFATIADSLAGGGYPWTDLYQAYHRLLLYHEHSDGIAFVPINRETYQNYETEQAEDREMVTEARDFAQRGLEGALGKLERLISTEADTNVVVFNPLAWSRTDAVRVRAPRQSADFRLVDASTGKEAPWQPLGSGEIVFVASEVPATGYRTYAVVPTGPPQAESPGASATAKTLENEFYRVVFDAGTGAITSIRDKQLNLELVESSAPQGFNEYLYQRFEGAQKDSDRWYRMRSAVLKPAQGPVAATMTVTGSAIGAESIQQTVVLYHDLKRIDFVLDLVKAPSGYTYRRVGFENKEAVYVALPFAIPDFQIRHELPGAVVEPIRQQFAGSVTAYYAVRHFTDISNQQYGVTVSSPEVALMEYGRPRSTPIETKLFRVSGHEDDFESVLEYPRNSRLYLYLLNNMFDTNIRLDQRGPMRFTWSMRSHTGNWQDGEADRFGWQVFNPLVPRIMTGRKTGPLPAASSFVSVDQPNVECVTIKPAEANGSGFILRLHETRGRAVAATVSVPFAGPLTQATETSLVEDDRPLPLKIESGHAFRIAMPPFGIKTVRVLRKAAAPLAAVAGLGAEAVSDMEIRLSWSGGPERDRVSHFNIYRGTQPGFDASLLHLVARAPAGPYLDRPQLNYGGWINQRLEPDTAYYYRVAAVDRWNNEGPLSGVVEARTKKTADGNAVPLRVEALRAVLVSPLGPDNYVNLLFRTNPESDVRKYEIHRSTRGGFEPDLSTYMGIADGDVVLKGSNEYGHVPIDFRMRDYDHMMYQDDSAQPGNTYFYRVCAVDLAGQRGPCSEQAEVRMKDYSPAAATARAQSYASQYQEPWMAIDGFPGWGWGSAPFGGGTRTEPRDTWLEVQLPRAASLLGVKVVMETDPASKVHRQVRVEYLDHSSWKVLGESREAPPQEVRIIWPKPVEMDCIRIYFPAKGNGAEDGTGKVTELLLILPDGTETTVPSFAGR